jgi:hypothetical protein
MIEQFILIARELSVLTDVWEPVLRGLSPEMVSLNKNIQNRSIRQILGHMVDSASNNTHRIVHMQYQESPISYPDYANLGNNDRWIAIQNYQDENWEHLVTLWSASHRHIAHVIVQVDPGKLETVWNSALGDRISLKEMITDFPRHFKLHIKEIETLMNGSCSTKP